MQDENIDDIEPKIPWHFWVFVVAAGAYLAYRLVWLMLQGINVL